MNRGAPADSVVALAVVAALVPDEPMFHGPAFNRAGQMFQDELIRSMALAGMPATDVFSLELLPSFPKTKRLFGKAARHTTRAGTRIRLLPFVNVQPLKALTTGLFTFAALVAWAWRHRGRQRVIHAINLTMPPGTFVWLAARLTGSSMTVSVCDVWKPGTLVPDTWAWRLDFAMQRWLLPRLDGHMVVTEAIADDLIPGRPVCVLEGGIAADRMVPLIRPPQGSSSGRFRIVLSGSLEPFNGVKLVAAAMARLPSAYELVVAGSGSLSGYARELAASDQRIDYRGFLSFEDVVDLYASADLLLNARLTRAFDTRYFFPSKLMELLASGVPVLSTCTGHVESEYGHVLYLLRDETPEALADRIEAIRAIDRSERQEMGARARAFMLREKTWTRQGERLVRYIQREVLHRRD